MRMRGQGNFCVSRISRRIWAMMVLINFGTGIYCQMGCAGSFAYGQSGWLVKLGAVVMVAAGAKGPRSASTEQDPMA